MSAHSPKTINRLKRIEGQVRGIIKIPDPDAGRQIRFGAC